jgi:hypothetical protein
MMGEKYIVIGTYYKDRFIAVEYLGETQKFIKIKEGRRTDKAVKGLGDYSIHP